jgi:hypothetical protein
MNNINNLNSFFLEKPKKAKRQHLGTIIGIDKYKFAFEEELREDGILYIFVGKNPRCLEAFIDSKKPDIVYLEQFNYFNVCNISEDLEDGIGTYNMMISFIKYIKQNHKYVKCIRLSDTSAKRKNGINLNFYKLFMLKYCKGYYEHRFRFKLDNQVIFEDNVIYDNNLINIDNNRDNIDKIKKIKLDVEDFKANTNERIKTNKKYEEFINLMINDESVSEFIKKIPKEDSYLILLNHFINYIFKKYDLVFLDGALYIKYLYPKNSLSKNNSYTKKILRPRSMSL